MVNIEPGAVLGDGERFFETQVVYFVLISLQFLQHFLFVLL